MEIGKWEEGISTRGGRYWWIGKKKQQSYTIRLSQFTFRKWRTSQSAKELNSLIIFSDLYHEVGICARRMASTTRHIFSIRTTMSVRVAVTWKTERPYASLSFWRDQKYRSQSCSLSLNAFKSSSHHKLINNGIAKLWKANLRVGGFNFKNLSWQF